MKPIFGVNRDNKNNKEDHSESFVTAKVSDALMEEYEAVCEQAMQVEQAREARAERLRNSKKTKRMMILCAILVGGSLLLSVLLGQIGNLLRDEPWLVAIGVGYLVIFGLYMLYTGVIKKKGTEGIEEEADTASIEPDLRLKEVQNKIYASLGVDETAKTVDVLYFDYKTENGVPVPKKSMKRIDFLNMEMKIFRQGETLCLVDEECRYEFPMAIRGSIQTLHADCSLMLWNKSTPCDEGEYRLYGMKKNAMDNVLFDCYHILEWEDRGDRYALYFPCYELPVIRNLIDDTSH